MIRGATDPSDVTRFFDHPQWSEEMTNHVLDAIPSGIPHDSQGRPITPTPGTVPWPEADHKDLVRSLVGSRSHSLTPENWDRLDAKGYLTPDQHGGNNSNISKALRSSTFPTHLLTKLMENPVVKHGMAGSYGLQYRNQIIQHPNLDPNTLASLVEHPDVVAGKFPIYHALLGRDNLPPNLINRMIQRTEELYPRAVLGDAISDQTVGENNAYNFFKSLADTHHAPDDWMQRVHQIQEAHTPASGYGRAIHTDLGQMITRKLSEQNPDMKYTSIPKVIAKVGSAIWRKLRDVIEGVGGTAHLSEIQKDPIFAKLNVDKARVTAQMTPEEYEKKFAKVPPNKRPPPGIVTKTNFVSSDGVQKIIDTMPAAPALNVSNKPWQHSLQSHAYHKGQIDNMLQFNITSDHIKKFKEAGLLPFWQELSQRMQSQFGAHQLNPETIGWIRHNKVTPDNTIHVTEMQSDLRPLAGSWVATVRGIKDRGWGSRPNMAQAVRFAMSRPWKTGVNGEFPAEKLDKLNEIMWGKGNDPDEAMLEGLHQKLRDEGHHNVTVHMSGLGMAGALRHGHYHNSVPQHIRPTLKGPLPAGNPHQIAPEAVHMVEAYEDIPRKLGYDMDSAKYGDEPTQVADEYKGWSYHTSPVRKFEELTKGIETLPSLPFSHASSGDRIFSASHYLSPEHKRLGYTLNIRTGSGNYGPYSIAEVHHGANNVVGGATMYVGDDMIKGNEKRKYGQFDMVGLKDQHIGKKLGLPIYEALLASAKGHHGCTHIKGLQHSSMAHSVHQQLATKHGLQYEAQPNFPSTKYPTKSDWESAPNKAMDGKWGQYSYTL
jgi:hypothetical protein